MTSTKTLAAALLLAGCAIATSPARAGYQYTTLDVPGALETQAYGIDDAGRVVGAYRDAAGWHGFRWAGGSVTTLDFPGAAYTDAFGIGPGGTIVGSTSPVANPQNGDFTQGYVYAAGTYTALAAPGAAGAFGINGAGTVVGSYAAGGHSHGAVWSGGSLTTLDVAGADDTNPTGINEAGQIVGGYGADCAGCAKAGFLWTAGTFTSIVPFGALLSGAFGLNDLGAIVGWYGAGDDLAGYLFDGSAFVSILPPDARYAEALDINNAGVIVGAHADADGVIHGFIATPVPEPGTLAMVLPVLGFALARFRRAARVHNRAP